MRDHRFTLQLQLSGEEPRRLVIYARSISEAIAKADGWVHTNFEGVPCVFTVSRHGYSSAGEAQQHGAIFPRT